MAGTVTSSADTQYRHLGTISLAQYIVYRRKAILSLKGVTTLLESRAVALHIADPCRGISVFPPASLLGMKRIWVWRPVATVEKRNGEGGGGGEERVGVEGDGGQPDRKSPPTPT